MKKKALSVVLILLFSFSFLGNVAIAEQPPAQEKLECNLVVPKGTANLIFNGFSAISDLGNRRVAIYAFTDTYGKVEYVSGRVYLQKWDGYKWVNVDSRLYYKFNHQFAEGYKAINVSPGYYRAYTIHYAENNGVSDTKYTTTSHLYIN